MHPWLLLMIAVASNVVANTSLKKAMLISGDNLMNGEILQFLKQPWLWVGIIACIALLSSYLLAIRHMSLSFSYAVVTTLALALLAITSSMIFGDKLTAIKIAGIVFVITGILLMSLAEANI